MSDTWLWMRAADLGAAMETGGIDPRALTEVYLDAIEGHPHAPAIYARLTAARARAEADAAAARARAGLRRGPLDGVPVSWKDLFDTAGVETACGSSLLAGRVPAADAEAVRRFYPKWPDRELRIRADVLASCDETAVLETHEGFETEDFFAYWAQLTRPVVLVRGGDSPVVPLPAVADLRRARPDIEIVTVPGAGHMVPWDQLDGFLAWVLVFILLLVIADLLLLGPIERYATRWRNA